MSDFYVNMLQEDHMERFISRVGLGDSPVLGEFVYQFTTSLVRSLSLGTDQGEERPHKHNHLLFFTYREGTDHTETHRIQEEVFLLLREFRFQWGEMIQEHNQIQQDKGKNLLFQLNAGTLTLNDFNENSI